MLGLLGDLGVGLVPEAGGFRGAGGAIGAGGAGGRGGGGRDAAGGARGGGGHRVAARHSGRRELRRGEHGGGREGGDQVLGVVGVSQGGLWGGCLRGDFGGATGVVDEVWGGYKGCGGIWGGL